MSQAVEGRAARAAAGLAVLLLALGLVALPLQASQQAWATAVNGVFVLASAGVGLVIVTRRPGNRVGWIYLLVALSLAAGSAGGAYIVWTLADPSRAQTPAMVVALLGDALWVVTFGVGATMLLLVFPSGRLPSRRWRGVVWLVIAATALATATILLAPGPVGLAPDPVFSDDLNPLGTRGAGRTQAALQRAAELLVAACLLAAVASLLLRWRRARGAEREQVKWLAFGAVAGVAMYPGLPAMVSLLGYRLPIAAGMVLYLLATLLLPLTSAIAIVRHRLYDIDRLVSRTIVYGALSAALASVYAVVVLLLSRLLGGTVDTAPSWAVAGATLAAAALFHPLRRRLQDLVDRRFNRRRYDAMSTVEAFTHRLRDDIDLRSLTNELSGVVERAVEPTQVALWLRPTEMLAGGGHWTRLPQPAVGRSAG